MTVTTERDVGFALAIATKVDPRTCRKWVRGEKVSPGVGAALERATGELGLVEAVGALRAATVEQ